MLTVMMQFLFRISHAILLCFHGVAMLRFLSLASVCPAFPPLLFFALNLAADDGISGMVNADLLLLSQHHSISGLSPHVTLVNVEGGS
jgi:hypothetical protein